MPHHSFEPDIAVRSGESVRYRMYGWWNALLVSITVLFAVVAVVAVVSSTRHSSAWGIGFLAVWIAGATLALRWYAWGVASDVTVVGERLTWSAPLRTRSVDVADLVGVAPYGLDVTGVIDAFELADGSQLPVMVRKGFADLVADLAQRRPGITIELGSYSRACGRRQRKSGFSRGTPR